ncbi:chemotaxis protein CheW [Microvirga sp. M2]|uniref:chemotaxis protein CheW n=1 Tax=Microvirga sp. M2 TaxID=3073270 RepID=UPI0039C1097D
MKLATVAASDDSPSLLGSMEYPTVMVAGQMLGLPIHRVHDVFVASEIASVPLGSPEIAGLLNLRGRVVTAISLRRRLGLPDALASERRMAVGLEHKGEAYGLLVDDVGEVLKLDPALMQPNPVHLSPRWAKLSQGVYQLEGRLLIVLDVDAALNFATEAKAA